LIKCGKNIVDRGRPQMAIWRMRIACWIPKATNTHSEYVIYIYIYIYILLFHHNNARTHLSVTLYVTLPVLIKVDSMGPRRSVKSRFLRKITLFNKHVIYLSCKHKFFLITQPIH
jgi:hypothetical protein